MVDGGMGGHLRRGGLEGMADIDIEDEEGLEGMDFEGWEGREGGRREGEAPTSRLLGPFNPTVVWVDLPDFYWAPSAGEERELEGPFWKDRLGGKVRGPFDPERGNVLGLLGFLQRKFMGMKDSFLRELLNQGGSSVSTDTGEVWGCTKLRGGGRRRQRQLLAGRVNMLFRDRRTHAHTRQLMETEAGMSREAWGRAMDASDLAHGGVISLRTTVHAQMAEIAELQSADRRRQRAMSDLLETDRRRREEMRELRAADRTRQQQIIQTLTAVQTLQRETIPLQGLVTTLQEQVTALQGQVMTLQGQVTALQGQQGPTGGPAPPELPEEAGSSS
ncbi:hypothetical protein Tco_0198753 [Tanacetum coccineum]